ncbi:MAG: glycosyl hydrolase [Anaerolineae bacterium]|nr:glycosyl hydrolase [Thermoflexales bacterium]MDW8407865.1 glycosyl hydrolase [Anaerolineae bacterium]
MTLCPSKPYTRWWWFSGPIAEPAIRRQLDWAKMNGFGGVEIAWLYPLDGKPGPKWLSAEWAAPVAYAKHYCDHIGLGCDFTIGSAWPFGGSEVTLDDASLTYNGLSSQRLEKSWDYPLGEEGGYILNHLDRDAVARFLHRFTSALGEALRASPVATPALFCDSWEVWPEGLWARHFREHFQARLGYDILPFMSDLDAHPAERYDYRKLIADYVLDEFYRPLSALCHQVGVLARVQAHGAPTDLLAAYAAADIPETEALLFDPDFARFAASAAVLAGRPIVSSETFTCLYGWQPAPGPSPFQGQEQLGDLKLLADAVVANGVNHIVWHGMPYNPPGGHHRFYTTTHVGADSPFADRLPAFNAYLATVCEYMRRGRPYTDGAVYLPLEDAWMAGELPADLQKPSSKYVWELQETKLPPLLRGRQPFWISASFLRTAQVIDGRLCAGQAAFNWLYVDAGWLDAETLADVLRVAQAGLPIYLCRRPQQPGCLKSAHYDTHVAALCRLPNVYIDKRVIPSPPLVAGEDLPDYFCRVDDDAYLFFFAHPDAQGLRYPMRYGHWRRADVLQRTIWLNTHGVARRITLSFAPAQSILLRVTARDIEQIRLGADRLTWD